MTLWGPPTTQNRNQAAEASAVRTTTMIRGALSGPVISHWSGVPFSGEGPFAITFIVSRTFTPIPTLLHNFFWYNVCIYCSYPENVKKSICKAILEWETRFDFRCTVRPWETVSFKYRRERPSRYQPLVRECEWTN